MNKEIVLITGTSSGFGLLATIHLASIGYFVIATMRDLNKKEYLLKEVRNRNLIQHIDVISLDVTNEKQIDEVKQYVETKYKKLDILINNAGFCLGGLAEDTNLNDWRLQLETNVISVLAITKAFLPIMRTQRSGKIINLGSVSGRFGYPGMGPYVTSKFALSGLSESMRLELLPFNIYVSLIEAGAFKTNIWEKSLKDVNLTSNEDYKQFINMIYRQAKETANHADDPMKVIKLIEKICRSQKPCFRYPIGRGVRKMISLKGLLPWSLIEWTYLRILNKEKNR